MKTLPINSCLFFACVLLFGCTITHKTVQRINGHLLIKTPKDKQFAAQRKSEILQINNDLFIAGKFTGTNKETINYRLLTPDGPVGHKNYPLVLVLPHSGGVGTNNTGQMGVLVKFWAQDSIRKQYPAYVVAVQPAVRSANYSKNRDSLLVSVPDPCLLSMLQLVDSLKKTLAVDTNRIYTVGFSMGASTGNNAMVARPNLFAASICASGIPMQDGFGLLSNIPIWLIHGNADTENPIPGDRAFYKRMQDIGHHKTLFFEIKGMQHEIYPPLYTTDTMPKWLFSHQKGDR